MPNDEQLEELLLADETDHVGFTRYLCERYLKAHPDHGPVLLIYSRTLVSLAQYAAAKATLDYAQTIITQKRLPMLLAQRGHLLEAQGDFSGAEAAFLQAHIFEPRDATHLIYAGSVAFGAGSVTRAENYARKAIECPEGCIDEAYYNLGGYLLSMQRYQEAGDCYRKALELDPDYEIAKERLNDVELILRSEGQ